MQLHFEKASTD